MIELNLDKSNRLKVARAFAGHHKVNLMIQSVVEGQHGVVVVDQTAHPTVFQIKHGPFHIFAGDSQSQCAEEMVREIPASSHIMPSPHGWIDLAQSIHGSRLTRYERNAFSSEQLSSAKLRALRSEVSGTIQVFRIDKAAAERICNDQTQLSLRVFDSADDFLDRGVGFMLSGMRSWDCFVRAGMQ
jgi:hypothetical protein